MEGKKIWMRLGVTVPVTDDELFAIMEEAHRSVSDRFAGCPPRADSMDDYDMSEEEAEEFLKRAVADGESYIPEVCFYEHVEWWKKERERRLANAEET